ncbi:MAG: ParB/RepB/Spo0J family partition protein [Prevotellaceae bacterium]|jgi:ParB family chromosome partitioning protein|nr:ParB/RepB/Spo0J family partition protein [Prevotellaceae bacterium]
MKKQALGRGLGALIDTDTIKTDGGSSINEIDLAYIHANPNQPRNYFDEESLEELAASIRENGIISPLTLRKIDDENYQIIAGERRYRASKLAGLEKVPAYIRTADDEQIMAMALIENIQREDLNAIEIALSYNKLIADYNLTQERLSERVGKKRATIANYLRLLKLPAEVQLGITNRMIDMGHARALASLDNPIDQKKIYEQIVAEGYSVRQTEEIVRKMTQGESVVLPKTPSPKALLPEEAKKITSELEELLLARVKLKYNEKGKGIITIPFSSDDDLMRLMSVFDRLR